VRRKMSSANKVKPPMIPPTIPPMAPALNPPLPMASGVTPLEGCPLDVPVGVTKDGGTDVIEAAGWDAVKTDPWSVEDNGEDEETVGKKEAKSPPVDEFDAAAVAQDRHIAMSWPQRFAWVIFIVA
jgi:hypothetical protein